MPRVALDLRLAAYRAGGIARYAVELERALARMRDVEVVPLRSARDLSSTPGVRLRTPPHHRLERWTIPAELALRRVRVDLYHATDVIAPRTLRLPVVATVHDLSFVHWPGDLPPDGLAYYRRLDQSARQTDAFLVDSAWTGRDLAAVYGVPPERIHVVYLGVSLGLLAEPPLPRAARKGYVLAVGTIEPRKRYELLLDAYRCVVDLPPLVVAGQPGWNTAALERRLAQTPGVTWLRDADDARLRALYREALAVAVPSRAEGFGLPALEAMAVGTPVVSSGGGALPEVTGDAALEVREPDPAAWAAALARLREDSALWERLSRAGRARAAGFTWERTARETAAVYRHVVR